MGPSLSVLKTSLVAEGRRQRCAALTCAAVDDVMPDGTSEAETELAWCARRKPRFIDSVYDLFSSGDFFLN